jgi:N-acetylmuramoyl-L-alanine amidase
LGPGWHPHFASKVVSSIPSSGPTKPLGKKQINATLDQTLENTVAQRHNAPPMTRATATALLLASLVVSTLASTAPARLSRIYFLGTEYVRVDDWARSHGFRTQWTIWKEELKITGPSTTLVLNVDSRRIFINGVSVWLSTPIAFRNGIAYIAPIDISTSVNPVLFPPKNPPGKAITTICLDPGHGGKDPGNREGPYQEKKYTLLFAQELRAALAKVGFKVVLTRSGDSYPELEERPAFARRRGADLFVSLHFNSADSSAARSVQGVEVYCLTPSRASSTNTRAPGTETGPQAGNRFDTRNMLLAYQVQRAMIRGLGAEDRGVRRARWAVLRSAEMPAVLIEAGFMTHPLESKKIYTAGYRQQMAQAITSGIVAYKKAIEQPAK